METLREIINHVTQPQIAFTAIVAVFFFVFPPNDFFYNVHKKLGLHNLWTKNGGIAMFAVLILFFLFGFTDENFRKIVTKPDNVPIVGLIFLDPQIHVIRTITGTMVNIMAGTILSTVLH